MRSKENGFSMNSSFKHGGTVFSLARQLGVPPESILDYSASINPLGPPSGVRKAVTEAFDLAGHYPEPGSPSVCKALADYHSISGDNIAVANGSTELIHLLPRLFRSAAGRALLIAPTFSEYANALGLAGWKFDYLVLNHNSGFELDCEKVAAELANGYDLLFFCNPGNPSGKLYSPAEIDTLARLCKSSGCFFVLDEAFIDFAEESSAKHLLPLADSGLILRSMTKFFGFPGLRLGYAIASPAVTSRLQRFLPPWNVGIIPQAAAVAALADKEHRLRTLDIVARERRRLAATLAAINELEVFDSAANYLLIRLKSGLTAAELQGRLQKELILIRDCSNYEGLDNSFFRVAVKGETDNKKLLQAIAGALK